GLPRHLLLLRPGGRHGRAHQGIVVLPVVRHLREPPDRRPPGRPAVPGGEQRAAPPVPQLRQGRAVARRALHALRDRARLPRSRDRAGVGFPRKRSL
ncbi:MAG: hypothetical protein AVDCRST_MAG38-1259, partial [uncultured Solirubrobacteraceae bacterium]